MLEVFLSALSMAVAQDNADRGVQPHDSLPEGPLWPAAVLAGQSRLLTEIKQDRYLA